MAGGRRRGDARECHRDEHGDEHGGGVAARRLHAGGPDRRGLRNGTGVDDPPREVCTENRVSQAGFLAPKIIGPKTPLKKSLENEDMGHLWPPKAPRMATPP